MEDIRNEHRLLSVRLGLEKVQVLPDCSSNRTGDSHVVFQPRPSPLHGFRDYLSYDRATFHPKLPVIREVETVGYIPYYKSPKALIADQYVGTKTEDEVGNPELTRGGHGHGEVVRRVCAVENVSGPTDTEGRIRSKLFVSPDPRGMEP